MDKNNANCILGSAEELKNEIKKLFMFCSKRHKFSDIQNQCRKIIFAINRCISENDDNFMRVEIDYLTNELSLLGVVYVERKKDCPEYGQLSEIYKCAYKKFNRFKKIYISANNLSFELEC